MKQWMQVKRTFMMALAGLALSTGVAMAQTDSGSTYVLVHGSFQTGAGWSTVADALRAQGNTVVSVDLPGRGEDSTPLQEITLDSYRDAVIAVVEEQTEPVVLVGHSFAGFTISAVAETIPDRIDSLVYLAGYLPRSGDSLTSLSAQNPLSQIGPNLIIDPMSFTASVAETFTPVFCPECTPEQADQVAASLVDEPLQPLNQPVMLTEENFGAVRKVYIMTATDTIVSPQLQVLMLANTPVDAVYALNASHAAYFTVPDALADLLGNL